MAEAGAGRPKRVVLTGYVIILLTLQALYFKVGLLKGRVHRDLQGLPTEGYCICIYSLPNTRPFFELWVHKQKPRPPAGIDVFVISVCRELWATYGKSYLFSSDEHMLKVASKLAINTAILKRLKSCPLNRQAKYIPHSHHPTYSSDSLSVFGVKAQAILSCPYLSL